MCVYYRIVMNFVVLLEHGWNRCLWSWKQGIPDTIVFKYNCPSVPQIIAMELAPSSQIMPIYRMWMAP